MLGVWGPFHESLLAHPYSALQVRTIYSPVLQEKTLGLREVKVIMY